MPSRFGTAEKPYTQKQWDASLNRADSRIDKKATFAHDQAMGKEELPDLSKYKAEYKAKAIASGDTKKDALAKDKADAEKEGLTLEEWLSWVEKGRQIDAHGHYNY